MKRKTPPLYTYKQVDKKENLKTYRKIALVITAFFVILLIIWFMGTSFINALGVLSRGNSSQTIEETDNLPLLQPKLDPKLPDSINQDKIVVSGSTTANVEVSVAVNGKTVDKQNSDDQGNFSFKDIPLTDGLNLIKITARNKQGEKMETTSTVTLDKTNPTLTITSPIDGTNFPSTQKSLSVTGTTEAENIVYVNGFQAVVDANGKFSYNLNLQPGANQIEISANDPAGNKETVKLTVTVNSEQ